MIYINFKFGGKESMEKEKKQFISQEESNEIDNKNSPQKNQIVLFLVFLLIVDQFQRKKGLSKEQENWMAEDEYIVTMEHSPAFPLEKKDTYEKGQKSPILNLQESQEIYSMVNTLKPYMSEKNQYMLSVFEKWKALTEDLNRLSNFQGSKASLFSKSQPDTIIHFLEDVKPFIHQDYHSQLQQVSHGINRMLDIHQNILKLENTLKSVTAISDNGEKINELLHAFEPFMSTQQKKTVDQLKSISQVIDVVKTVSESNIKNILGNDSTNKSSQSNKDTSNIMELLDLLSPSSSDTDNITQEKSSDSAVDINSMEQEELEEPQYEEVFQEDVEALEELEKEMKENEKKQEE